MGSPNKPLSFRWHALKAPYPPPRDRASAEKDATPIDLERPAFLGVASASLDPAPSQRVRAGWLARIDMHSPDRRLILATVDPYVDRGVLAEQMEREEEQRRALSDFLGGWGASGGWSAQRCSAAHGRR
ncbi:hypothetical protein [Streptomyces mirabilis]|uniref:hypothetical protein n=1 Tax=Streptomyces mirabilis TaxID=68239 RepID=UPI00367A4279